MIVVTGTRKSHSNSSCHLPIHAKGLMEPLPSDRVCAKDCRHSRSSNRILALRELAVCWMEMDDWKGANECIMCAVTEAVGLPWRSGG